jgi:hypothetical protein
VNHEQKPDATSLDAVFEVYRQACPDFEASRNFMPELWRKIEARRKSEVWVWRWLNGAAATAALLTLITGYVAWQRESTYYTGPMPQRAYIEKLTDEISEDDFLEASYQPVKFTRTGALGR